MSSLEILKRLLVCLGCFFGCLGSTASAHRFESVTLGEGGPAAKVDLLWQPGAAARYPVILMLGSLDSNAPPAWSTNLVQEGWMLCAFSVAHPPDPDPARRPQWLVFDERFAHSYPLAAERAIADSQRIVAYLRTRPEVNPDKLGWFGSSSTGIPGLAVATQGPRLAAVLAFVSTGAYRAWLDTWQPNGLWRGGASGFWPETERLLETVDPILHATNLWPTATLLVNGGGDKVVDIRSARAFVAAARPAFATDPERLRLVNYEGFTHNLPADVVRDYAERWFRLYLHPINPPPAPPPPVQSLAEAARQTEINSASHASIVGAGSAVTGGPDVVPKTNRVIVVNFNPVLRDHGGVRLQEYFRWNDPRRITTNLVRDIREASGGYARFQVVDFIDVDSFPRKRDGFRYTEQTFLEMWKDKTRAHQPDSVSYSAIFAELNLVERIRREDVSEIWIWGAPYFGTDEYAMKVPGDRVFYQPDNPWFYRPYDIPDCGRAVWVMGFNYEVGEDNALHSFGHRCEGILSLTVGRGVWSDAAGETNAWSRFTRQADKHPNDAQVGNVHGGPNALSGYDYGQTNTVLSGAENWLRYPQLTGEKKPVNRDTWGQPYHLNYQKWWLSHLPRNAGMTDGFYNNWWRYIVDYDQAVSAAPPAGGRLQKPDQAMY